MIALLLLVAAAEPVTGEAGGMRYLFVAPRGGARVVIAVPGPAATWRG